MHTHTCMHTHGIVDMPILAFYKDQLEEKVRTKLKNGEFFSAWIKKMEFKNSKPAIIHTGTPRSLVCVCISPSVV